jgi:hypothetical protein
VALVRRFDPSGEELARWEVIYRDGDGHPEFFSPPAAKKAALNPTYDAGLHVGDLIVTVPAEAVSGIEEYATGLYVVTPDGVKAAPKPPEDLGGPWLARWGEDAHVMLRASLAVDRRRLVMAACDCAETVLRLVPAGEDRPHKAIKTARAWCRGEASINNVRATSSAARDAGHNTACAYAAHAASSAARAAFDASAPAAHHTAVAAFYADGTPHEAALRALAPLVERWIPLPVVLLSRLKYPDAIPFGPDTVPAFAASRINPPPHKWSYRR